MRRCLVTLQWQAKRWDQWANVHTFKGERLEGAKSYAHEQAAIRRAIANRFATLWDDPGIRGFRDFNPLDLDLNSIFGQQSTLDMDDVTVDVEHEEEIEDDGDMDDNENDNEKKAGGDIPNEYWSDGDEDEEEQEDEGLQDLSEQKLPEEEVASDMSDSLSSEDEEEAITLKDMLAGLEEERAEAVYG
ncbi:hypothetical protein VKT23_020463 [Stygiomarasmius scandens]|uniref:Uncharacterized protein n=1 Tax=Marasmiellus scandens TaxID=2682957 RepID=A0ABR1IJ02_9AGAR